MRRRPAGDARDPRTLPARFQPATQVLLVTVPPFVPSWAERWLGWALALQHRWQHWRRTFYGRVETWTDQTGRLMVGFRCCSCGVLSGIHPAPFGLQQFQTLTEEPGPWRS
jgi:hypothetical protein